MKIRRSIGMVSMVVGNSVIKLYYPSLFLNKWFFSIDARTGFRISYSPTDQYSCIGFTIFGFGIGMDYEPKDDMPVGSKVILRSGGVVMDVLKVIGTNMVEVTWEDETDNNVTHIFYTKALKVCK